MSRRGRVALNDDDDDDDMIAATSSSAAKSRVYTSSTADQKLIKENLENGMTLIEALAKRLKANKEGILPENVRNWQEKIKEISLEAALVLQKDALYETTANQILSEKFLNNSSNQNQSSSSVSANAIDEEILDVGMIKQDIHKRVENQLRNFKPESVPQYKGILKHLIPVDDEDEDLVVEDIEMTDQMTKCPFTLQIMLEPLKNNNSAAPCIHHISRDGLGALLRGGKQAVGKCPTAGCKGQWKASTSEVDEVFKRKIERYLRMKEARTQHTQSHRPAIDAEEIS